MAALYALAQVLGGCLGVMAANANPAVTVARMLSDSFAGIAPASAPMFIVAQLIAVAVGVALIRLMAPIDENA